MASTLSPCGGKQPGPRPRVIELAGPAGAGKSTLSKVLVPRLGGSAGMIWGQPVLPLLLNGAQLMPTFTGLWTHSRSPLWDETRHMVRLRTLYRHLGRNNAPGDTVTVFDEGPVFAMAWLRGFGHETLRAPASARWWSTTVRQWASMIDAVIVLDAPDELLARRIRARPHDHEVKEFADDEIARWMARFRDALEWVLRQMDRHDGPQVLRLSSVEGGSGQLAKKLVEELSGSVHGH